MAEQPSGATDVPPVEWDEEVEVTVLVRVRAKGQPDQHYDRAPVHAAMAAIQTGRSDLSGIDGFADLEGEAHIVDLWPFP